VKILNNEPLAPLTSFGAGGPAEKLITIESSTEIDQALNEVEPAKPVWPMGYGTNVLISDEGLSGTTLLFRNDKIEAAKGLVIADAGVWWDDLVQYSIERNLWGLELMSGIPGSVGAGVFINITAYGQALADQLEWVEAVNDQGQLQRLNAKELAWGYKQSIFQSSHKNWVIVRAAFSLKHQATHGLTYQSALDAAQDLGIDIETLADRRKIIMEARARAGSLFSFKQGEAKTVGSFFRNPFVTPEQAELVMSFDETGKTKDQIAKMNAVHGGDNLRVSAAHVLLAAGFKRGQEWGPVRLHPKNLLKIENARGATAQQIYDVAQEIMKTVQDRLGIKLEPEAQLLGGFN
jgi:UDP-N-acetylmuramate dehydrogenase